MRTNLEHGIDHFPITEGNFARNRDWEPGLNRLIEPREGEARAKAQAAVAAEQT